MQGLLEEITLPVPKLCKIFQSTKIIPEKKKNISWAFNFNITGNPI